MNWRLVARPLDRAALLDMRGDPDSCGIWAPCLTHDGERFWLVYTDVKRYDGVVQGRAQLHHRLPRRSRGRGRTRGA